MDPLQIALLALAVVFFFMMFRSSRRRRAQQDELLSKVAPGVEVMTNFGLFGTLKSVDEVTNVAEIETSPGVIVRVHRQTIAKVMGDEAEEGAPRSVEEAMEIANREEAARAKALQDDTEPQYGERIAPDEKPARRTKKTSE